MRIPKLLIHSKGFFFVRVTGSDGKRHDYNLGRDKSQAEVAYKQFVSDLCQKPEKARMPRSVVNVSIAEIVVQYLESIQERYEPSKSFVDYRQSGLLLCEYYKDLSVSNFTIACFQSLIRVMIAKKWALRTINVRIGFIKQFFKHALDCELITAERYFQIKSVERIRASDPRVKSARIVPPVKLEVIERTLPYFSPMIADMVTVQLHSGMRAGELCRLNWSEIDYSRDIWVYRPVKHKNASKGKKRSVPLGPRCIEVLERYKSFKESEKYIFNPRIIELHRSSFRIARSTNILGYYTSDHYTREIRSGVEAAIAAGAITEDERWTSHQLRHRAGTDARAEFGIDAAQLLLGHSDVKTTERYAIPDESKLLDFAKKMG